MAEFTEFEKVGNHFSSVDVDVEKVGNHLIKDSEIIGEIVGNHISIDLSAIGGGGGGVDGKYYFLEMPSSGTLTIKTDTPIVFYMFNYSTSYDNYSFLGSQLVKGINENLGSGNNNSYVGLAIIKVTPVDGEIVINCTNATHTLCMMTNKVIDLHSDKPEWYTYEGHFFNVENEIVL